MRIACGGVAAITASAALSQPVPDAGSTLRQLEPPTITLPRKPPPGVDIEAPARPVLQPAPALRFALKGFRITGATVFAESDLQQLIRDYVGRDVGIVDLGEAVGRITRFYSQRGYPLATAYLPVQDIKDGVVELVVIEGRFGNVQLLNRTRVRDAVVASHLTGLPGSIVEDASIERRLLLIYDLSGVAPAKAVLHPGQAIGETDLRLELEPGPAVAGAVELDNHGSRFSGANRLSAQFDLFSPARLGDWFSVRATKGDPGLEYGRVSYLLPVGDQGVRIGAAYSHVRYQLGGTFAALGANGDADTGSLFATYPFVRSRRSSLYGRFGLEQKNLQDRISSTGTVTDRKSTLATLALAGDYVDGLVRGATSAFSVAYSNGELKIESPPAKAIDDLTARTAGGFHKWNLNYVRLQNLSEPLSLLVSFYGQKAGKNLDSSEKLILGGANGVRAYPQGEAPGDTGYVLSGELRYAVNRGALPGSFQVLAFADTGEVTLNAEPFAAGANRRRLSGGGVGLNWTKANDFTIRVALAHRIGNARATAGSDSQTRGWLQAIKYF